MRQSGFTLIELMIVVAVVAVLLLVALPAYQDSVRKARRADGTGALLGLQLAQEKFRANCRFYAGEVANADVCGTNAASSDIKYPNTSNEGYYNIAIDPNSVSGNSYTLTATADPLGAQAKDKDCLVLQIEFPTRTKTPVDCWN